MTNPPPTIALTKEKALAELESLIYTYYGKPEFQQAKALAILAEFEKQIREDERNIERQNLARHERDRLSFKLGEKPRPYDGYMAVD